MAQKRKSSVSEETFEEFLAAQGFLKRAKITRSRTSLPSRSPPSEVNTQWVAPHSSPLP